MLVISKRGGKGWFFQLSRDVRKAMKKNKKQENYLVARYGGTHL
jgi:hypothetical protein